MQKNKAGKGPRRARWGRDPPEAAEMLGCLLCRGSSLLVQVSFRLDARQGCAWEDWGSLTVFREGVLLAWKGAAAPSIAQILSIHPKAVFSEAKLPLAFRQLSGKQPLRAGRSLWWASSGSLCAAPLPCQALICIRRKWREESILCSEDPDFHRATSLCYCHQS